MTNIIYGTYYSPLFVSTASLVSSAIFKISCESHALAGIHVPVWTHNQNGKVLWNFHLYFCHRYCWIQCRQAKCNCASIKMIEQLPHDAIWFWIHTRLLILACYTLLAGPAHSLALFISARLHAIHSCTPSSPPLSITEHNHLGFRANQLL